MTFPWFIWGFPLLDPTIWVLFFFPLWWKGNYSPLPQQLPQCFRDHSASFRDAHLTYNPSASFCDLVFLVFASATTAPLRFQGFWLWSVSVPFILACWAFICFLFGLFLLLAYVRLSWAWTLWGHRQGVPLFGHVFLPRCFRKASARLPRNTEAKPNPHNVEYQNQIPIQDMETELHQDSILSAVFYQHPLPQPSAKDILPRSFRGLNPVRFLMNNYHRKPLHKNAKKRTKLIWGFEVVFSVAA